MRSLLFAWVLIFLLTPQITLSAADPAPRTCVFQVKGMTCVLCAKAIERALDDLAGIESVVIDSKAERVTVVADPKIAPETIQAVITSAGGFEAEFIPQR